MPVWNFIPTADKDDPRWLNGPIWSALKVRAKTSGQARLLASKWEADLINYEPDDNAAGGTAMSYQSALADPVLYSVTEAEENHEGPEGVIEASQPLKAFEGWERVRNGETPLVEKGSARNHKTPPGLFRRMED